ARITSAPARSKARAVSIPRPDEAPVIRAVLPERSCPPITSAAVEVALNGDAIVILFPRISLVCFILSSSHPLIRQFGLHDLTIQPGVRSRSRDAYPGEEKL